MNMEDKMNKVIKDWTKILPEYKDVFCHLCNFKIQFANDENTVKLNEGQYILCPTCYTRLCDIFNAVEGNFGKVVYTDIMNII